MDQILGARSYIPSVISATRTAGTLKSPGIPTLPRWTFEGGTESCALSSHVRRFREESTVAEWCLEQGSPADRPQIPITRYFGP